ncbi:MAG: dephospho-CoA kinase [Myxococcales bacterium]
MPAVRLYGLTGNIGVGKSAVARLLREAGVPVLDADQLAREAALPGTEGLREIGRRFPGVVGADGALDRKALAARVFGDAGERAALNAILHPRIAAALAEKAAALDAKGTPFAVYEAALLVENGLADAFAGLIVVTAPLAAQLARLRARDGMGEPEARARLAAQLPQKEKVALADFVLDNAGSLEELRKQVAGVLGALRGGYLRGSRAGGNAP